MKPSPLASRGEFHETVSELATLETLKRALEAERDAELQQVNLRYDDRLTPIIERMKGKLALAEAYADTHRAELLPKDVKSALVALARYGWRTGNRTVKLMSKVTEENAIAALKALGLASYVQSVESIAKSLILADCKDDKTITVITKTEKYFSESEKTIEMTATPVLLSDAGLKIAQGETFFIEPTSEAAETMKAGEAA